VAQAGVQPGEVSSPKMPLAFAGARQPRFSGPAAASGAGVVFALLALIHPTAAADPIVAGLKKVECHKVEEGVVLCEGLKHYSLIHLKVEPDLCAQLDIEPVGTHKWWTFLGSAFACVCVAAMAAGLTLGLTSIDEFGLQVLCNRLVDEVEPNAEPEARKEAQEKLIKDQKCAQLVLPVISGHYFYGRKRRCGCMPPCLNPSNEHYLLVTLLLCNAVANEALPLFLDTLVPSWLAIVLSVSVVLIFGEIIPSAVFTGKSQLVLAAAFSPVVRLVKAVVLPIAWPLSLLLDKSLGHQVDEHRREDLKALVRTMKQESHNLDLEEMNMIHGVLELHHKTAEVIASPLSEAKMLAHDAIIDEACIKNMRAWGHSRLFVYRRDPSAPNERDDIIGVIIVKKLLGVHLEDMPIANSLTYAFKTPVVLGKDQNLLSAFDTFRDECCHLAIVADKPEEIKRALDDGTPIPLDARPTLFCSMEDVLEEMLKEEIYDEDDRELQLAARNSPPHHSVLSSASSRWMRSSLLQTFNARHIGTPRVGAISAIDSEDEEAPATTSSDEGACGTSCL